MNAAICQMAIRGHRSVANQNHHVRDVDVKEDHCTTRHKSGMLGRLRSLALNCLRATCDRSATIELKRDVLNFEHLGRFACGRRNYRACRVGAPTLHSAEKIGRR
jgi:hypothetical protein